MKKLTAILLTAAMLFSAALCFAEEATGEYVIFNQTGEALTELYLYPVGSEDKGENLNEGFRHDYKTVTYTAEKDTHLVLEFTTESGYKGSFDSLAIEVAPITLLAADAKTGATDISFTKPQATGEYVIFNQTGEALTELFIYPVGSEDKGENLNEGFRHDYKEVTYTGDADLHLVIEFTTESGYKGSFDSLAIEVAPITLLAADAKTGATDISFAKPQATGIYNIYNLTGETLSELFIYPVGIEDKGENLATNFIDGTEITYTGNADLHLVIEFTTESGYKGSFDNLAIEVAPISLLAADAKTGATDISFTAPEK